MGYEAPNPPESWPIVTVPEPIARSGDPGAVVPSTPWSVRPHVTGDEAGNGEIAWPAGTGPSEDASGVEGAPVRPDAEGCGAWAVWAAWIRSWMLLISLCSCCPFALTSERTRCLRPCAAASALTRP